MCHGNFLVPTEGLGALRLQGTPGAALDGQGTGAALSINAFNLHPTRMVSVQSLRVTNGRPGITVSSQFTSYPLTLRNVVVTGNESTGSAAGISVSHATLNLFSSSASGNDGVGLFGFDANLNAQDSTFANNADRGIDGLLADVTLDHTVVSGNTTSGVGGGIRISGGFPLDLTDSVVSGNQASEGGGIAALDTTVRLTGSAVLNNVASGDGGGIYSAGSSVSSLEIVSSTVSRNTGGGSGGGIFNSALTSTLIQHSRFSANKALSGDGGGIANLAGSGAATISSSTLSLNEATNGKGGAVFNAGDLTLDQSTTMGANKIGLANKAVFGGGIYNDGSHGPAMLTLQPGTSITGNIATIAGGGIYNDQGNVVINTPVTIVANRPNDCIGTSC